MHEQPNSPAVRRPWVAPGDVQYLIALVLASTLAVLPSGLRVRFLDGFSRIVARLWYAVDRKTSARVSRHLRMLFANVVTDATRPAMVRAYLALSVWNALILNLLPSLQDAHLIRLIRFEGLDKIAALREAQQPVLLLGAHYGVYGYAVVAALTALGHPTWLVGYSSQRAPPAQTSRFYNWLYWPRVRRLEARLKQVTVIPGSASQPELVDILARKTDVFYLLPDQYFIVDRPYLVPVQFLGRTIYLDSGVIRLAKRMGAQAFTAIPYKDGRQQCILIEPLAWSGMGTDASNIANDLQAYAKRLEDRLVAFPGLWRDLRRHDLLSRMQVFEDEGQQSDE